MNGLAECAIQTICQMTTACLANAKFSDTEWQNLYCCALIHSANVYNVTPHRNHKES